MQKIPCVPQCMNNEYNYRQNQEHAFSLVVKMMCVIFDFYSRTVCRESMEVQTSLTAVV